MDVFFIVVACLLSYCIPGIIMFNTVWEAKKKSGASSYQDPDMFVVFMRSCVWPVVFFARAVIAAHQLFKNGKLPKRKTAEQKVLNYSEAPVKVLSQIIAQRIMAQPEGVLKNRPNGDYQWVWSSKDGKIKVETDRHYREPRDYSVEKVTVNGVSTSFDGPLILKALNEALAYNEMKRKADAEAERQQKALDAVEILLLTPEPTTTTEG